MKSYLQLLLVACIMCGAQAIMGQNIRGNGNVVEEARELSAFHGISVGGAYDVYVKKGSRYAVLIKADENIIPVVETKVKDQVLHIRNSKGINKAKELSVYITTPDLTFLQASGASDVEVLDVYEAETFKVVSSGASDLSFGVNAYKLDVTVSGSSDLKVSGNAKHLALSVSGSGDFHGKNLTASEGKVRVSGSGDAHVHVTEQIEASVSGSGDVYCVGNPRVSGISTSGSGDIHFND
ncbi:head GIN domain-containing protein [Pontibacter sp. G13]|uniref:head GIN domain-containing protein n=1 Tax=Pontibacter sp. G13 TaxID=3074898 RepID=UPI002889D8C0|nr:head GIN domain-containing protein [Pontibacter sp. G13]WNJ20656.1 head GIN domain-containing protein [Pontibacter sp. G13]